MGNLNQRKFIQCGIFFIQNKPIFFICRYTWRKNNETLKNAGEHAHNGTLVIELPKDVDAGKYQCVAINEHGNATSKIVSVIYTGTHTTEHESDSHNDNPESAPHKNEKHESIESNESSEDHETILKHEDHGSVEHKTHEKLESVSANKSLEHHETIATTKTTTSTTATTTTTTTHKPHEQHESDSKNHNEKDHGKSSEKEEVEHGHAVTEKPNNNATKASSTISTLHSNASTFNSSSVLLKIMLIFFITFSGLFQVLRLLNLEFLNI